jgi:hypothetical protein
LRSHYLLAFYINTFLKIKQEASGFPDDCQTPEQQQKYIQEILQREGILMNPPDIQKNPVRRTIAIFFELLVGKICSTITTPEISVFNRKRITTEITRCHLRNQKNRTFREYRTPENRRVCCSQPKLI